MSTIRSSIRSASVQDAEEIARIQIGSYRQAYAGIFPPEYLAQFSLEEQTQDWRDWLEQHPQDILLVAELDGPICGYALSRPSSDVEGYDAEVLALHVRRSDQRRGVGRALFTASAREMAAQGCRSLMLWVLERNPSRGFYEHLDGVYLTERSFEIDEAGTLAEEVAYGWGDIRALLSGPPV